MKPDAIKTVACPTCHAEVESWTMRHGNPGDLHLKPCGHHFEGFRHEEEVTRVFWVIPVGPKP